MSNIDWLILAIYMLALIAMSVFLGKGQENAEDYYVGGRNLPWWAVGLSTMATQCSVVSFVSIPAFVALKEGGGLLWIQYEMSVPLAMVFIMVVLIPFFRRLELVSVYEYLEMRFDRRIRLLLSGVFLFARGLGSGVGVYTTALVLQVCTGLDLWIIIVGVGIITVVYDSIGGMAAVVWSDVVQLVVLFAGIFICIGFAAHYAGGVEATWNAFPADRAVGVSGGTGVFDGAEAPFIAYLFGGFFLYVAYYGTDQSQTQRELSAPTLAETKKSLILNGFGRAPLTGLYLLLGIAIGAAYAELPELQAMVDGQLDNVVPYFVVHYLPTGVRAVLIAAMLAAGMSSLDSSLNSLSASTMQDFVLTRRKLSDAEQLRASKVVTITWGVAITIFAFFVGGIADTVLEAVNKIGSAFNGPILATFVWGVLTTRVTSRGVVTGVALGVASNLLMWILDVNIHFMWWNMTGFLVASAGMFALSGSEPERDLTDVTLSPAGILENEKGWGPAYGALVGFSVCIIGIAAWIGVR
ncbi:MAG: sodium/solute symporter [Myxococcota bacterium]